MKRLILLLILLLSFISKILPQNYILTWSDEFNGSSLDQSRWSFETGNNNGWGNNELEYYTSRVQNCSIQNGILTITAAKENYNGYSYTSARIKTQNKFSVKYGKIEAKIKLPFGQGLWPAFWLLGDNVNQAGWPECGEIDIMEMIGGQGRENTVHGSAHWGGDETRSYQLSSGIFADSYHVFDVTWTPEQITWHVDGITYNTLDITPSALSAFQKNFFIVLNLAVGGSWPGNPDNSTIFPQIMQVDYVRVYKDTTFFPDVSIISPQNNSSFLSNSNIDLTADASMQSGKITKVEFYQGAMKIGETYVSPYRMTWNNVLAGNYKITCTAYSNSGLISTSDTLKINVGGNAITSPYGGEAAIVPGTIEAEDFDLGGEGKAYYDSDIQNSGGEYRASDGVDIETCSDIGGGYDVGWTNNNEWLAYTIFVKESGTYQIGARVASNSEGGSLHFEIDDTDRTGTMSVTSTGGLQIWTTILSKNFNFTSGIHQLKLFINSAGFNINKIDIYPSDAKSLINFVYPEGGELFSPDSIVEIKWDSWKIRNVNIGFSTNEGSFWSQVQNNVDAKFGVYRWKIPAASSSNCKLIISASDNISVLDTSKSFSIGSVNYVNDYLKVPASFLLSQNYPDPFNPSTTIEYGIFEAGHVRLEIFNSLGELINTLTNSFQNPGNYSVNWNGKDSEGEEVSSGVYFYSLSTGGLTLVKKMMLMK